MFFFLREEKKCVPVPLEIGGSGSVRAFWTLERVDTAFRASGAVLKPWRIKSSALRSAELVKVGDCGKSLKTVAVEFKVEE